MTENSGAAAQTGTAGPFVHALGFAEKTRSGKTLVDYGLEPVDGNWKAVNVVDPSDDGGIQASGVQLNTGRSVDGAEAPTKLRFRGPLRQGPLDVNPFARGTLVVSEKARDVIEGLDPGLHQFFPVSVMSKDKVLAEMFILVVAVRLDGHNHELTRPRLGSNRLFMPVRGEDWRIVFDPDRIAGHHLWHEKHRLGWFLSSELVSAFDEAELEGYKLSEPLEVART